MRRIFNFSQKSLASRPLLINFFYLATLQGLNLILPLLTLPFLIRTIGLEHFGLLSLALAVTTFFQVVVDYGFNATATRDISLNKDDFDEYSKIYNDVFSTKLFLLLISFAVFCTIIFLIPLFKIYWYIYLFSFGNVIGQALFPLWFFQGIQKMKYITIIQITTKTFFTIMIFVFVKKDTFYLAPIFTSLGYLFSGFVAIYVIKKQFKITFQIQSFKNIKKELNHAKYMFFSELKISLFTSVNTIILGFLADNKAVGAFVSAEKLVRAIGNIQTPISNTLFPFLANEIKIDRELAFVKIKKIILIGVCVFTLIIITSFIFADFIIELIFGSNMQKTVLIFRILIFIPLASFLDNMLGKQILLNLGKDNLYFKVILWATIFNLCLNTVATFYFNAVGTALVLMLTQILIVIGMAYYVFLEFRNQKT